jgi:hypothetical protein
MANVFFSLKLTWPSITNDIRVSVYNVTDTSTPIASVQQNTPHLDQQYDFPGLPRVNFIYKIFETEINGSTIISQLGQATFVPAADEFIFKTPVDVQIGVTQIEGDEPNVWPVGATSVTIPAWIGFEIFGGRNGVQYPMVKDVNYSWDAGTGELSLLNADDVFQDEEYFHWEFEPIINASSGGVGVSANGGGFSDILVVTSNTTLAVGDIGKKILIDPSGNYLEITLPDYATVEANNITYFEMVSSAAKCARIKTASGNSIAWLESLSNLYICPGESFELYKRVVSTGVYEWRIQNAVGNFLSAGELFYSDLPTASIINAVLADGSNKDYQQYARLYNRFVLKLSSQAITYATWSGSNVFTRTKFSLKDTGSNNFRIPDLITTPSYLCPAGSGTTAGDFKGQKLLQHQHASSANTSSTKSVGAWGYYHAEVDHIGKYTGENNYYPDLTSRSLQFNSGTGIWEIIDGAENNPNSRISNLYIRC